MDQERIKFQALEIFQANLKFHSTTNGQIGMDSIIQKLLENRLYLWVLQEIIEYAGINFSVIDEYKSWPTAHEILVRLRAV